MNRAIASAALLVAASLFRAPAAPIAAAQSDLDAFMQRVMARRDDNWKKLQQYILDEREQIEVRGPARVLLWGERRDYTWYVRDGFFVRSPLKSNGVTIGEEDRRKYEADYLRRVQRRDQRAGNASRDAVPAAEEAVALDSPPGDVTDLIRQTRQPQFISSAYFLRFTFDAGTYALVGAEQFEGRELLRIEYYPTKLFSDRRGRREGQEREDEQFKRLMNKVALVTLWIEPASHQIVKFNYDNVSFDFLPAQWLFRLDDVRASMTMSQPFPDVWLPRSLEVDASLTLALGKFGFRYALDYHDYRQAEATIRVR